MTDDVGRSTEPQGSSGFDHQGFAEFCRGRSVPLRGSLPHAPSWRLVEAPSQGDFRAEELRQPAANVLRRRDLRRVSC